MADLKFPNLNFVLLSGRLVQDPELRYTPSGRPVARMRIASDRRFKDQSGEWQTETLFVDVIAWRDLAERCADKLRKGSPVIVEGYLRSRSWETESGQRRSVIEVVGRRIQFLEKFGEVIEEQLEEAVPEDIPVEEEPEDDLPF
ncbi:MAG TPA: single-stranded DNA-binding protein [candidate division WOR-3 bacterium]|uniref:Single-stranded DNA-binding protein n=1 Tax=candidate division WOR-3 bacterium TaxID=2052148 RepID=A0A7V0LUB3_UNCW3|nr:MAG: single-stranded DNA-binding protein [Candidatus Hydrothermae bacterium]HDL60418.1 single-stranded DNA-binding protein [candidate division WOR-3 bacterium]